MTAESWAIWQEDRLVLFLTCLTNSNSRFHIFTLKKYLLRRPTNGLCNNWIKTFAHTAAIMHNVYTDTSVLLLTHTFATYVDKRLSNHYSVSDKSYSTNYTV